MVSCDASEIDAQVKKLTEPCQDPRLRDYPNRFVAMTVDLEDGRFCFFLVFCFLFWGERGKGREGGREERGGERKKGRKGRKGEREKKGVGEGKGRGKEGEGEGRVGKVKRERKEKGEKKEKNRLR